MLGGHGLGECSRQKEQLLVIHFSQQIGTKHLSDARNQKEHPGYNDEQSTHTSVLTQSSVFKEPQVLYFLDLKRPLIVR